MKKVTVALIFLGIIAAAAYFLVSNKGEGKLWQGSENSGAETEVVSEQFTWSATDLERGPQSGGSDFISASDLRVSASGKTHRVNDYLGTKLYGCQDVTAENRDSTLARYDSMYSPSFFADAVSYYLCPSIGGGNLFVIEKAPNGYAVKHYPYGDGMTPFTQLSPAVLFTISN